MKKEIFEITEEVKIGKGIILEKGDKIKLIKEFDGSSHADQRHKPCGTDVDVNHRFLKFSFLIAFVEDWDDLYFHLEDAIGESCEPEERGEGAYPRHGKFSYNGNLDYGVPVPNWEKVASYMNRWGYDFEIDNLAWYR